MKTQNFNQRNSKGRLLSVFYLSVCVLWVRHELGKMGISFQASLPVYCHFKLSLLVCIGCWALRACSAQGEHSCSKTSPFLKGGINALSECLFTCTFTLWVYKYLTWGKYKSLSSARWSAPLEIFPGMWPWHCKGSSCPRKEGFKPLQTNPLPGSMERTFPERALCRLGLLDCSWDNFSRMQSLHWWRSHWGRIWAGKLQIIITLILANGSRA